MPVIGQQEFTVRAATLADAKLICDLINDVDLVEIGAAEYTSGEVTEDLRAAAASWLAFDRDRLVAYGALWDEYGNGRIDIDHYVRAGDRPAGIHIIEQMIPRATEAAAANGASEVVVHLHLPLMSALSDELPKMGWTVVRRHHVLKRPVSVEGDPLPAVPPGVVLRTAEHPDDQHVVYELLEESFKEHFDHQPRSYPLWREAVSADDLDWSLVWIANLDGRDVGALLARNNRSTMGWVRSIGVLKSARGRGIATLLLRTAFAEFALLGRDTVGLGVDTQNSTGAFQLYEGLGMTLHFAADNWEIRLPLPHQ